MDEQVEIELVDEDAQIIEVLDESALAQIANDKPARVMVVGDGIRDLGRLANLVSQSDPYARPTPELLVPPEIKFDAIETDSAPDGYELDFGDDGKETISTAPDPGGNEPVVEMDATRKAAIEAKAKIMLAKLRRYNNRLEELERRKTSKTKKRRKRNKLAKASRKRNR